MSTTKVKICGLQQIDLLKQICELPVDYVGFILANSRRRVERDALRAMVSYLKSMESRAPLAVGVFVNPDPSELEQLVKQTPLDVIQLHGQESPELCRFVKEQLGLTVAKVLSVSSEQGNHSMIQAANAYLDYMDILLLDTYDPVYGGGSGRTFNWEVIPQMKQWAQQHRKQFMVAGGLHPGNVKSLIEQYKPDAVDVSSGVETNGSKDIQKIISFVERVKQT